MPWPNDSNPLFGGQSAVPLSDQHLAEHQNIRTAIDALITYLGLPPNIGGSALLSRLGISPNIGPIYWIGASYEDLYNAYYVTGGTPPYPICQNSDGLTWAALTNQYFGQQFGQRWAPPGSAPNPLGQCYAVSAASVAGSQTGGINTSMVTQIAKLLSDHGGTLPSGAIVVIDAGINDIDPAVFIAGGIWQSPVTKTWALTSSGGFTIPASGTINLPVLDSTGAIAGTTAGIANSITFEFSGLSVGPFVITAVPDGTHITVATYAAGAGIPVPNSCKINSYAGGYLDLILTILESSINNLIAGLPANGLIIVVGCPNPGLLPGPIATGYGAVYTATWNYWRNQLASGVLGTTAKQVASWDMSSAQLDVVTNFPPSAAGLPSKFGFKNVAGYWGGSTSTNPSDYAGWDTYHPTGAMHAIYAYRFIEFLKIKRLLSVY